MLSHRKRGHTFYIRGSVRLGYRTIQIPERATDAADEASAARICRRIEAVCTDGMLRDDGIHLIQHRIARVKGVRAPAPLETRVYAIWAERVDLVKIGYSDDVRRRFSNIQAGSPDTLHLLMDLPGGQELERELHFRFKASRVRGEWFRLDEPVLDLLARIANVEPMPDGIGDRLRARMMSANSAEFDPD